MKDKNQFKKCCQCEKILTADEKGLCCKYLAPKQGGLCLDHMALYLRVDREVLEEKIEDLKEGGCPYFS